MMDGRGRVGGNAEKGEYISKLTYLFRSAAGKWYSNFPYVLVIYVQPYPFGKSLLRLIKVRVLLGKFVPDSDNVERQQPKATSLICKAYPFLRAAHVTLLFR